MSPGEAQATVVWSDPLDWEGFVSAAQRQGASQLFLGREFADHDGNEELAQVMVCWIQNAAVFALVRRAIWYADEKVEFVTQSRSPGELTERDEATLTAQMLAFVDGREADFDSLYGLKFLFWETKGIRSRFASDGETRVLMQKVEAAVERTLYEREKETIPDLVATCAAWARTQNAKRVTKANIEYFLTDRAISLSRGSRDALYNETNFALAKPAN